MLATLSPFPSGWYAVGFAHELVPGALWSRTFCGEELVVFRTEAGALSAVHAFCPHLGAHMGKGGCVRGELLECPFHAFRFGTDGVCREVAYGTKAPPKAVVRTWPVREVNGVILVWHGHAGEAPTFEVPALDADGWAAPMPHEFRLRSHPQETTENSVDFGHLSIVHGYDNVEMLDELQIDGAYLTARYAMTRDNPFLPFAPPIRSAFRVHVHGLGVSIVDVEVQGLGLRFRLFVLPQPIDGEFITLRVGASMHRDHVLGRKLPLVGPLVDAWIRPLVQRTTLRGLVHDVGQDFEVWENKIYVDPPALAKGDGPIGLYRRYCKQFYPVAHADAATAAE